MTEVVERRVAADEHELLAGASSREPLTAVDGLSGVRMESVVIDGERFVAKWLGQDVDWIARMSGDTECRPVVMWETGLYDRVAPYVDAAVVGASRDRDTGRSVILMRDVSAYLLPEGAVPLTADDQEAVLDAMAGMHAGLWGFEPLPGLCTSHAMYHFFAPDNIAAEAAIGTPVPSAAVRAWEELHRIAPAAAEAWMALATEPAPLVRALEETPQTLVHSDWKGGNLGRRPDGRTILLDWAFPGAGAGCRDLAWYLAVNCDRLPSSKEHAIQLYQASLERRGIDTAAWFDRQLELCLLGAVVLLGWSKTGDAAELAWWTERTDAVAAELLR
jgi:hypothetical protein